MDRFDIVMAEKTAHDVVTKVQSVRDPSPTDVSASQRIATSAHVASEKSLQASQTPSTIADHATTTHSNQNEGPAVEDMQAESGDVELGVVRAGGGRFREFPLIGQDNANSTNSSAGQVEGPRVNGIYNGQQTIDPEVAEDGTTRTVAIEESVSGESTEGTLKDLGDNQEQARPNALKKSTTFKPVSVTKNFLAKAGTPVPPAIKSAAATNNAAAGTGPQGPRPRLVAKSASGQRASAPKAMSLGNKTDKQSGPDPNQVWNRNRGMSNFQEAVASG